MKRAVENPVAGLTLPERLQKQRQDVIYDIKQNVANALMTGERYDTTAKKIAERLDVSYGKAMRITRTESHRVQEAGLMDGAAEVGEKVREDGLVYAAIWHNMGDSKVRPYARVHTSKGWKTYKSKTKADHVKMEGQIIEAGDDFDLGNGVKAKSPGQSGTAENDCNCRCYVEYEMMTEEEFIERGGKLKSRKSKGNAEKTKMAYNQAPDWSKTQPVIHSKEERKEIEKYAKSKNLNIYNISVFDGNTEILKEQIDVISDTLKQYNIANKVTLSFSNEMSEDDFAETVNNTIIFNTKALRSRNITNEILNADNYLSSADIKGIAVHETGHLISKKYGNKGVEIAKEAYYNIYKEEIGNEDIIAFLESNVSEYSTDINDFYANKAFKMSYYKEIIPEVLAKNETNANEFTREFVKLLGVMIK